MELFRTEQGLKPKELKMETKGRQPG